MESIVIAVVGSKDSGKTTTIEALTKELTRRGYKVAVVKHIPEMDFTMDTKGKDTWRFAKSGAKKVVGVSPNEIAVIEKVDTSNFSLKDMLERCQGSDIILVEGFRKILGKNEAVPKIVAVKSLEEAIESQKTFKPIIAFTSLHVTMEIDSSFLCVDVVREPKKLADIVEEVIRKSGVF